MSLFNIAVQVAVLMLYLAPVASVQSMQSTYSRGHKHMLYGEFISISASAPLDIEAKSLGRPFAFVHTDTVLSTPASKDPSLEKSNCMNLHVELKC